jgi:hypothetical protein
MKAVLAIIAAGLLGQAMPAAAAPVCPPRVSDEGEPFLDKAPKIPKKYQSLIKASKTDLAIASESGNTLCVKLGWIFQIDKFWNSPDQRFVGFDYFGYETHGYILIDRKGAGQEIATGAQPLFSPDKKHFAFAQLTDSGWGNFEGAAIWSVDADGSQRQVDFSLEDDNAEKLPHGFDWKVDRWIDSNNVSLSMIHPDELITGKDYRNSVARSPRRYYQFRRRQGTWRFHDCAVSDQC